MDPTILYAKKLFNLSAFTTRSMMFFNSGITKSRYLRGFREYQIKVFHAPSNKIKDAFMFTQHEKNNTPFFPQTKNMNKPLDIRWSVYPIIQRNMLVEG